MAGDKELSSNSDSFGGAMFMDIKIQGKETTQSVVDQMAKDFYKKLGNFNISITNVLKPMSETDVEQSPIFP